MPPREQSGGLDRRGARAEVSRHLTASGDRVEAALELMKSPDPMVRWAAIVAVEGDKDARLTAPLVASALGDPSMDVRHEALLALEDHISAEVLPCLLTSVRGDAPRPLRITAAKQLGSYDTEASIRAIVDLVDDEDAYVAEGAIESLVRLQAPSARALYQRLARSWAGTPWGVMTEEVVSALGPPGPEADALLLDKQRRAEGKLASNEARDRLSGLRTMSLLSPGDLIDRVSPLLRDTDPRVRAAAATTLGGAGDPRATPLLLDAALDPSDDVKAAALRALGERRDPAILGRLIVWASDPSFGAPIVRSAVALALGDYDDNAALEALRGIAGDDDTFVRTTALDVLERREG